MLQTQSILKFWFPSDTYQSFWFDGSKDAEIILSFKDININLANKAKLIFVKDRPGHDLRYCLNSSKIKNNLKWFCKYNFKDGIKKTIIWYMDKFNESFFKNNNFKKRIGLKI